MEEKISYRRIRLFQWSTKYSWAFLSSVFWLCYIYIRLAAFSLLVLRRETHCPIKHTRFRRPHKFIQEPMRWSKLREFAAMPPDWTKSLSHRSLWLRMSSKARLISIVNGGCFSRLPTLCAQNSRCSSSASLWCKSSEKNPYYSRNSQIRCIR